MSETAAALSETEYQDGVSHNVSIWDLTEHDRRIAFARRASRGARKALGRRHDILIIAPTIEMVEDQLQDPSFPAEMPSWKRILFETALKHSLNPSEILSKQRSRTIVKARHEAMYRMKTETTMSLPQIARRLGRADHSTVHHGIKMYLARVAAQ